LEALAKSMKAAHEMSEVLMGSSLAGEPAVGRGHDTAGAGLDQPGCV
jgi:hypothetical protein